LRRIAAKQGFLWSQIERPNTTDILPTPALVNETLASPLQPEMITTNTSRNFHSIPTLVPSVTIAARHFRW
jgi:hypothetical protein